MLRREERVEVDGYVGQRFGTHDPATVDRLGIRAVRSSAPDGQAALIGVDIPDFQIAALLIVRQLLINVVLSRRWRPNFDNQGKRLWVRVEASGPLAERLLEDGWNDSNIRNVVGVSRSPQAGMLGA